MIGITSGDARYAIMKKTEFGPIDICSYHDSLPDAYDEILSMESPHEYEIFKIDREEVRS
jgi:hypothetical protein